MANAVKSNGDLLKQYADDAGMSRRTIDQVKVTLTNAKKYGSDREMARLMLRHGRLTDEARAYVEQEYPQ